MTNGKETYYCQLYIILGKDFQQNTRTNNPNINIWECQDFTILAVQYCIIVKKGTKSELIYDNEGIGPTLFVSPIVTPVRGPFSLKQQ